jgi:hypothetical protein
MLTGFALVASSDYFANNDEQLAHRSEAALEIDYRSQRRRGHGLHYEFVSISALLYY